MKKLTLGMLASAALLALSLGTAVSAGAASAEYSSKTYVPAKSDLKDYWGGGGEVNAEQGGGITTFAHAGLQVPLKGEAISLKTSFMLYSRRAEEEGGDAIDAWCTYSFTANSFGAQDTSIPNYSGNVDGYFLQVTNLSSTNAPNCVEIQVVEETGGEKEILKDESGAEFKFFLDNFCTKVGSEDWIVFTLSLTKVEDYDWTLNFEREDGTASKTVEHLPLDEDLFINDNGQTFFGTAIYEGGGAGKTCDDQHWEHRGVRVYSIEAYTCSTEGAEVTLDEDWFVYDGQLHRPNVTVKVGGVTLEQDVDYSLRYTGGTEIGTGKVRITFINSYAGNAYIEKEFTVSDQEKPSGQQPGEQPGGQQPGGTTDGGTTEQKGCGGVIGMGAAALGLIACGAAVLFTKKRH